MPGLVYPSLSVPPHCEQPVHSPGERWLLCLNCLLSIPSLLNNLIRGAKKLIINH
jgi:hypothetical protein